MQKEKQFTRHLFYNKLRADNGTRYPTGITMPILKFRHLDKVSTMLKIGEHPQQKVILKHKMLQNSSDFALF